MGTNRGSFGSINDNADYSKKIEITSGIAESAVPIDLNDHQVYGVKMDAMPMGSDGVNVAYVLAKVAGLSVALQHTSVVLASTAQIDLATATSATLVDGVAAGTNRILLTDQITQSENGIYIGGSTWARATDMDDAAEAILDTWVLVTGGLTLKDSGWYITTAPATIDSDPMMWSEFTNSSVAPPSAALLLDCSNDPLTGNLEMSKVTPELRLTDSVNGSYAEITKENTDNKMILRNVANTVASQFSIKSDGVVTSTITCGNIPEIESKTNFSVSYWVKQHTNPTVQANHGWAAGSRIFAGGGTVTIPGGGVRVPGMTLYGTVTGVSVNTNMFAAGVSLTANQWYHIVWTFDGSQSDDANWTGAWATARSTNRWKCYVNGQLIPKQVVVAGTRTVVGTFLWWGSGETGNGSFPVTWDGNGTTLSTTIAGDPNLTGYQLDGQIDEFQLYDVTLSAGDVTTLYGGGYAAKKEGTSGDTGIVAGYHFNEGTGLTSDNYEGTAAYDAVLSATGITWQAESGSSKTLVDLVKSQSPAGVADGDGITTFGDVDAGTVLTGKYVNCAVAPVDANNIVNKAYVDAAGVYHAAAAACIFTYGNVTGTYSSTGNGSITGLDNTAFNMNLADFITLSIGDRVLFAAQTTPAQDGIYSFTQNGDGATVPYVFTRVDDWKHGATFYKGSGCGVTAGDRYADTFWVANTTGTVGTTDPAFDQLAVSDYDLAAALNLKLDKTGGALTGPLTILYATNPAQVVLSTYNTTDGVLTPVQRTVHGQDSYNDNEVYTNVMAGVNPYSATYVGRHSIRLKANLTGAKGISNAIDWTIMGWINNQAGNGNNSYIYWTDPTDITPSNFVSGVAFTGAGPHNTNALYGISWDGTTKRIQNTSMDYNKFAYENAYAYFHFAVTWNNTSKAFTYYINGVKQEYMSAITTHAIAEQTNDTMLWSATDAPNWTLFHDIGIYDAVLDEDAVAANYNKGHGVIITGADTNILHGWNFNSAATDLVTGAGAIDLTVGASDYFDISLYNANSIDVYRAWGDSSIVSNVDLGDAGGQTRLKGQEIQLVHNNTVYTFDPATGTFTV